MSRRTMMGGLVAGAASASMAASAEGAASPAASLKKNSNADFYKSDGTFDVDTAKQAYYDMFAYYGYPIPPRLRGEDFWAVDFGLGIFTEVGMAGIFWVNRKEDNYFGHDIYLLPGQMIPEHKHVKTPDAGPKMEGWHVRHGSVHIYGEGTATPGVDERIPESHRKLAHARSEQQLMPGEVGCLAGAEQWHWMRSGAEGAIVTEYATYHDGNALRFSHPDIKF